MYKIEQSNADINGKSKLKDKLTQFDFQVDFNQIWLDVLSVLEDDDDNDNVSMQLFSPFSLSL